MLGAIAGATLGLFSTNNANRTFGSTRLYVEPIQRHAQPDARRRLQQYRSAQTQARSMHEEPTLNRPPLRTQSQDALRHALNAQSAKTTARQLQSKGCPYC